MIFKLLIDPDSPEQIVATVHRRTELIDRLEQLVAREGREDRIPGYREEEITMLSLSQVECFYVEKEKTYAVGPAGERYHIRYRLYELEQLLPPEFERISKSAIANWRKITKFRVQLSGTVDAVFRSGYTDYISRRCFAELKRRYHL